MSMNRSGQRSVVGGQSLSRRKEIPLTASHRPLATAFSLVELLIVIGIIILLIGLAVPALNLISGSRSIDSAENQVSAMLGVARVEAIGVQQHRGVFFYYDRATETVKLAMVQEADPPTGVSADVDLFLDLVVGADAVSLPRGVMAMVVDDPGPPPPGTPNDRYIGFNDFIANASPTPRTEVRYGGVILFDSRGQLASRSYVLKTKVANLVATPMGNLLFPTKIPTEMPPAVAPVDPYAAPQLVPRSQIGLILFDRDTFMGNDVFTLADAQIDSTVPAVAEAAEEDWLDSNALPLMVNRYNGTLIKGE